MRVEKISVATLDVRWRDERRGVAMVSNSAEWNALLAHYQFESTSLTDQPITTENDSYLLALIASDSSNNPRIATIDRKPQTPLQTFAWAYAEETRMARIECQDGALGVRFLDEDVFVPFSQLALTDNGSFEILSEPIAPSKDDINPNHC